MLVEEHASFADLTPRQSVHLFRAVDRRVAQVNDVRVNDLDTEDARHSVDMLHIMWAAGLSRTPKGQLTLTDHSRLAKNQRTIQP